MKKIDYYEISKQKLKYLGYSTSTQETYIAYIGKFFEASQKYPTLLSSQDFQSYLDNCQFTSISQQNQIINAIRFLYREVLGKKYDKVSFKRPKKERKLPKPIDKTFLIEKINKISNLKHKAIISLAFSCGLRVSEICNLKISEIDSNRMLIKINQGKGKKDRFVPLSQGMLELLRKYFLEYKPKEYLFNGQFSLMYSHGSCNQIVKKYLGSQYHFHQLRHSCFTSLHESGVSLRDIQVLAGHQSSRTTEIYTLVSNKQLSKLPLPL